VIANLLPANIRFGNPDTVAYDLGSAVGNYGPALIPGANGADAADAGPSILERTAARAAAGGAGDAARAEEATGGAGVTVYRGTSLTSELMAHADTGLLMSDAARTAYFESGGSIDEAMAASQSAHAAGIEEWGSQDNYVQAHGEFGTELSEIGPRSGRAAARSWLPAGLFTGVRMPIPAPS
jgi:hypothetical protein